jgi:hypothetical protein
MADVMREAEKVLGYGVSHHKKAWSANETILKTSVSKWESQISLAQSEIIFLENEPEEPPPCQKNQKRIASLSAPSNSKTPAPKRPRQSLTQKLMDMA